MGRFSSLFKAVVGAFALVALCSCQWMKDKPSSSATISGQMSQGGCKVIAEDVQKFLEKDISSTLECLKTQLELYAIVDQRKDVDVLDQDELKHFLGTFLRNSRDQQNGIDTLFTINQHIFAGQDNTIPVKSIDKIFDFLIDVNHYVIDIYRAYAAREQSKIMSFGEYQYLRAKAKMAFEGLTQTILKQYLPHNQVFHELSTATILNLVGLEANAKLVDDAHHMRHFKRLLLGGDESEFTYNEIKMLLEKLPELGPTLLDLVIFHSLKFDGEEQKIEYLMSIAKSLRKQIFRGNGTNQIYFNIDDLIEMAKEFKQLPLDISTYRDSIVHLKHSSIIGGNDDFTYENLQTIFNHLDNSLSLHLAFSKLWDANEQRLLSPLAITQAEIIIPTGLNDQSQLVQKWKDLFIKVATTYRYMPDEEGVSIYGPHAIRSRKGMITIGLYEYVTQQFISAYGSQSQGMGKDDLLKVVMAYQDFVVDRNLWRNPISQMVNSQFLMGDFFRYHSNGDGIAEASEIVGIILMDVGSFSLAKKTFPEIQGKCQNNGCELKAFDGIPTQFFYQNFFKWVSGFKEHYPLLYNALLTMGQNERQSYARSIAMFTRHCPFDYLDAKEVPIYEKDLVLILGGMMSLEETFIRFDLDKNQKLSYDELEKLLVHFRPAIVDVMISHGFIPLDSAQATKYARTLFYYLIVNKRLPIGLDGQIEKVKFYVFQKLLDGWLSESKINADRLLLGQVLVALVPREPAPRAQCFEEKVLPD